MTVKKHCPVIAQKAYLKNKYKTIHRNFLLRFAIQELESWLLADYKNIAKMLGVRETKISSQPDTLTEPKKHLFELALLSSHKHIKEDLLTKTGHQGRLYLSTMEKFVVNKWDIESAMNRSPSLNRCVMRLRALGQSH